MINQLLACGRGMRMFNTIKCKVMARPIKETPTLRGKDAERFLRLMDEVQPVSKEEMERIKKNYEYIKSIATYR